MRCEASYHRFPCKSKTRKFYFKKESYIKELYPIDNHCVKYTRISGFIWPVFSGIRTESKDGAFYENS